MARFNPSGGFNPARFGAALSKPPLKPPVNFHTGATKPHHVSRFWSDNFAKQSQLSRHHAHLSAAMPKLFKPSVPAVSAGRKHHVPFPKPPASMKGFDFAIKAQMRMMKHQTNVNQMVTGTSKFMNSHAFRSAFPKVTKPVGDLNRNLAVAKKATLALQTSSKTNFAQLNTSRKAFEKTGHLPSKPITPARFADQGKLHRTQATLLGRIARSLKDLFGTSQNSASKRSSHAAHPRAAAPASLTKSSSPHKTSARTKDLRTTPRKLDGSKQEAKPPRSPQRSVQERRRETHERGEPRTSGGENPVRPEIDAIAGDRNPLGRGPIPESNSAIVRHLIESHDAALAELASRGPVPSTSEVATQLAESILRSILEGAIRFAMDAPGTLRDIVESEVEDRLVLPGESFHVRIRPMLGSPFAHSDMEALLNLVDRIAWHGQQGIEFTQWVSDRLVDAAATAGESSSELAQGATVPLRALSRRVLRTATDIPGRSMGAPSAPSRNVRPDTTARAETPSRTRSETRAAGETRERVRTDIPSGERAPRVTVSRNSDPNSYRTELRAAPQSRNSPGERWDDMRVQRGPRGTWRAGDPTNMPSRGGVSPTFDTGRGRYWRNRAHYELEARARGEDAREPHSSDPFHRMSDAQLRTLRDTPTSRVRAPIDPHTGRKLELEHFVPQRVRGWLVRAGFSPSDARRLTGQADPRLLIEVSPSEHAFFDVEANRFGSLRADPTGRRFGTTAATDERATRPFSYVGEDQLREIVQRANSRSRINLERAPRLRTALQAEIQARGLDITIR